MAGIYDEFGPQGWKPILLAIERDEFVEPARFCAPLRGQEPIPQEAREYLADLLDRSVKRHAYRPAGTSPRGGCAMLESAFREQTGFSMRVWNAINDAYRLQRIWTRKGHKKPLVRKSIEHSAAKWGMTADSLEGFYKRAKKAKFTSD